MVTAWAAPEEIAKLPPDLSDEALKIQFCKHYTSIQPEEELCFADRMRFDIYKRSTKDRRWEALKEMRRPRGSHQEVRRLMGRLDKDLQRRRDAKLAAEAILREGERAARSPTRKISKAESDRLYSRLVSAHQEAMELVNRKRDMLRQVKEREEQRELEQAKTHARPLSKEEVQALVRRMEQDNQRRLTMRALFQSRAEQETAEQVLLFPCG